MLLFLRGRASERKLRLAGCAYCRGVWPLLGKASRRVVVLGEELADRPVDEERVMPSCGRRFNRDNVFYTSGVNDTSRHDIAYRVAINDGWYTVQWTMGNWANYRVANTFIRDIFGNPFRPVAFDPAWLTSTAVALAEGIYADRAFDRLPILADALQDAGCDDADILDHCRGDGPHVRGCWVVDLVLGEGVGERGASARKVALSAQAEGQGFGDRRDLAKGSHIREPPFGRAGRGAVHRVADTPGRQTHFQCAENY